MDFKLFSRLIMIEQTFFALPFALVGVLFAGGGTPMIWVWTIIALAAARTAGMSFNRVIDAEIDAKNPRTKDRHVPKGEVSRRAVWITAAASSLLLIFASFMLNTLCFYLSFFAVFLLFTYSYFKRFSSSSHFYLGFVEAAAPIGGYLAVTGQFSIIPFILGFIILAWIAGIDIIYALQDMEFDLKENLHSVPVRLGEKNSLLLSAACYAAALAAMIITGILTRMTLPYWIAVTCIGAIFLYQQILARKKDLSLCIKDIFTANMYISPILFVGTLFGLWIK